MGTEQNSDRLDRSNAFSGSASRGGAQFAIILTAGVICAMSLFSRHSNAQTLFRNASPDPARAIQGPSLVTALRTGQMVIYFRHTAIEMTGTGAENCRGTTLSAQGREQAKFIADQFSRLKIPVGKVFSSPSCRTMDHARIAFGEFEPAELVFGEQNNFDKLADRLTAPHAYKGNLVIVGHVSGIKMLAGLPLLEYGEALVIQPGERAAIVARVKLADWAQLPDSIH